MAKEEFADVSKVSSAPYMLSQLGKLLASLHWPLQLICDVHC